VRDLALQVGQVHHIVIDQRDMAHAGGRQIQRGGRPQAPCADDEGMCREYALLPFDAHLVEQDVAGIAQELVIGHGRLARNGP